MQSLGPRDQEGWQTTASVSEVLTSLFRARPNDPIRGFRVFATPSVISALWVIISWLIILGFLLGSGLLVTTALGLAVRERDAQKAEAAARQKEFVGSSRTKVLLSGLMTEVGNSFLSGSPLDVRKLLPFREDKTFLEVMFVRKEQGNETSQTMRGAKRYEVTTDLGDGVYSIKLEGKDATLLKVGGEEAWVGVVLPETFKATTASDPTLRYLEMAVGAIVTAFILTLVFLLVVRLVCELVILQFRFVDEVVSINSTLRERK